MIPGVYCVLAVGGARLTKLEMRYFPNLPEAHEIPSLAREELLQEAILHVCRRAKLTPYLYLVTFVTMAGTTALAAEHPQLFYAHALSVFTASFFRLWTQRYVQERGRPRNFWWLGLGIAATSLAWAALTVSVGVLYGEAWILLLCQSQAIFAALTSSMAYAATMRIALLQITLLLAPGMLSALILRTDTSPVISGCFFSLWVISVPTLRRLHREYWVGAINAYQLATRTVEAQRAKQAAEDANHAKGEFLAMVSHELRTPLSGILGTSAMLQQMPLAPLARDQVAMMQRSTTALLRLLDDLLEGAKLDEGHLRFDHAAYSPAEIAEEVCALFRPAAYAKGLSIELCVAPSCGAKLMGDGGRVRQVLANLVSNGVKFSEQGRLVVEVNTAENGLQFSVTDPGPGIPASEQHRIFQRFERVTHASSRPGSGLGLVISREIVTKMGGEMGFESHLGEGSRFWFRLPIVRPASTEHETTRPPLPAGPVSPAASDDDRERQPRGPHVLLVDDDPVLRKVLRWMLEAQGCRVVDAHDGHEALAAVRRECFDLIFMDCQMPNWSGFETARRMREAGLLGTTRLLGMTANTAADVRGMASAAGMSEVFVKPIDETRLRQLLEDGDAAATKHRDPAAAQAQSA